MGRNVQLFGIEINFMLFFEVLYQQIDKGVDKAFMTVCTYIILCIAVGMVVGKRMVAVVDDVAYLKIEYIDVAQHYFPVVQVVLVA